MRLDLEVELPDRPGQLESVLSTVADHGANVVSVLHLHERAEDGKVPVALTVEIPEADSLALVDALSREHRVLSVDQEGGPQRARVLLVGHAFEADLRGILDPVFETGAEIAGVDARIEGREDPSAVLVTVDADRPSVLAAGLEALREHAREATLDVIEQVGGGTRG